MNVMDNGVERYFMSREDAERAKEKSESIVVRDAAAQIISLMDAIAAAVKAEREARLADIDMLEDIAYKATGHVAAANYQERHDEARMWIRNAWKAATIRARSSAQEERKS